MVRGGWNSQVRQKGAIYYSWRLRISVFSVANVQAVVGLPNDKV